METTHEDERCISIIRDSPTDDIINMIRKRENKSSTKEESLRVQMQGLLPRLNNRFVSQRACFGLDEGIHPGRIIVSRHLATVF